jgi:endonuclease YncB( thermonuclease family)
MKSALSIAVALGLSAPVCAQVFLGRPIAVDGDTIAAGDTRIRLYGIDSVERSQTCSIDGEAWACGETATNSLAELLQAGQLSCKSTGTDVYGRTVATCRIGSMDLGLAMIEAGLAVALPNAPQAYFTAEARQREVRNGIWRSNFVTPAEYRAANPRSEPKRMPDFVAPTFRPKPRTIAPVPASRFIGCNEARRLGIAPIPRGHPAYHPEMDGDGDGWACEPIRGR